jgi:SAM-dependent methyltransferase
MSLREEYLIVQGLESYTPERKEGRERIKLFGKIYEENKEFFGSKILDLACGGGIFSNFLAEKGHRVVGIDILEDMLKIARKFAPKTNKPKFIRADLLKFEFKEKFDTAIFLGNSITHFSPKNFAKLVANVKEKIKYFVISYRDSVSWGFTNTLKLIIIEEKEKFDVVDLYKGYEEEEGKIVKYRIIFPLNKKVVADYYLYNPATVEGIMFASGFKLVKRVKTESEMEKYFDFYENLNVQKIRNEQIA